MNVYKIQFVIIVFIKVSKCNKYGSFYRIIKETKLMNN